MDFIPVKAQFCHKVFLSNLTIPLKLTLMFSLSLPCSEERRPPILFSSALSAEWNLWVWSVIMALAAKWSWESWEGRWLDFPHTSINRNPLTIDTCRMPGEKERAEASTSRQTRYPQVFQSTGTGHGLARKVVCILQAEPAIEHRFLRHTIQQVYFSWRYSLKSKRSGIAIPVLWNPKLRSSLRKKKNQNKTKRKTTIFGWGGTFRHFHGSLIQSGLDLKAVNRNKPGTQGNKLDLVSAFLMLIFQGGFVLPLHDLLWNCGLTETGLWYPISWRGVCMFTQVCKGGRKKSSVLKSLEILSNLCSEWENGTLRWGKKGKAESLYSFFLQSFYIRKETTNFFEPRMEDSAGQSAGCL